MEEEFLFPLLTFGETRLPVGNQLKILNLTI